jgi:hypothetical protein
MAGREGDQEQGAAVVLGTTVGADEGIRPDTTSGGRGDTEVRVPERPWVGGVRRIGYARCPCNAHAPLGRRRVG